MHLRRPLRLILLGSFVALTLVFGESAVVPSQALELPTTSLAAKEQKPSARPITPDVPRDPAVAEAVDLALDVAYPLYKNGTKPDPKAFVNHGGSIRNDMEIANPKYLKLRKDAIKAVAT